MYSGSGCVSATGVQSGKAECGMWEGEEEQRGEKAGGRSKKRVNGKLMSTVEELSVMEGEKGSGARVRSEDKRGEYKGMMCSGLGLQWVSVEDADKR